MSAAPEVSRDGAIILFLSQAPNLTTNAPSPRSTLNLYMFDRRARATTLVSRGFDGKPANADVTSFQISTNNQKILFETAASNMIANDTNNQTDIFIRELNLNTNILVSANTSGSVTKWGGSSSSMNGDGSFVIFSGLDDSFVSGPTGTSYPKVYVRDMIAGTNQVLRPPSKYGPYYSYEPSISSDGRYAVFAADILGYPYPLVSILYDLQSHTTVEMAPNFPREKSNPLISANGNYVTFGINSSSSAGVTNLIVRYATETGATEMVVSNNVRTLTSPVAISEQGTTILYVENNSYHLYREGLETRTFPNSLNGTLSVLPSAAMSGDGKVVTFSTDIPLLPNDGDTSQFRTYIYDVDNDTLAEIPLSSPVAPPSDPVPNVSGSIVVFTGAIAEIQDETEPATHNIYLWERATAQAQLVSQSDIRAFENTTAADSKLPEFGAFSADGKKMVFSSRAPATEVPDLNGSWDVFLLDRETGRKQVISLAADGQSTGSNPSTQPIISGNGRFVAFFSAATNLTPVDTQGRLQLYVRDIMTGVTRLVRNKDGAAPARGPIVGSLSFTSDGKLLCFASAATDLDARDSQPIRDVYVYDTTDDVVSLVTYDTTNTTGANADCVSPIISPDGRFVAFRSTANNLGAPGNSFDVCIRDLKTGGIRKANVSPSSSGAFKTTLAFNADSTMAYFASYGPHFYSYSLTNTSFTNRAVQLATNVYEGSVSADGNWLALTRRISSPFSTQVYLRNLSSRVELCISSNVTAAALANGNSFRPQISADARFTVFESRASNLTSNDDNGAIDLFLYDRDRESLDLLSSNSNGFAGNNASVRTVLCPDQSLVAFVSFASDLVPHDYNEGADIFAAYFPAPDIDADGIDDRWEIAEFGNLNHDMTGDFDGDGMSDAAEFQAQTDPKEASSSLRLISTTTDDGANVVLRWASAPGRAYRVQARSKLDAASSWNDVTDTFLSSTPESVVALPGITGADELYFRIVSAD